MENMTFVALLKGRQKCDIRKFRKNKNRYMVWFLGKFGLK